MNNRIHGQGTRCTKMGTDSLAENTPNAPEFTCPSPKVLDFNEKKLQWTSVVRGTIQAPFHHLLTHNLFTKFLVYITYIIRGIT